MWISNVNEAVIILKAKDTFTTTLSFDPSSIKIILDEVIKRNNPKQPNKRNNNPKQPSHKKQKFESNLYTHTHFFYFRLGIFFIL